MTVDAGPGEMALPAGHLVGNRYRVLSLIGAGTRKVAHLCEDTWLDRPVVLLGLLPGQDGPLDVARLRHEAALTARLGDHPSVVAVHDLVDHGAAPYVVVQHLDGGTLATRLGSGPLPVAEALALAQDVAGALQHAHVHGVVHRDVKPANVWLDSRGRAVLGDFGLAVRTDEVGALPILQGTAAWLAPEQALGGRADPRSDLYSLGALLYTMLCGRPPHVGASVVDVVERALRVVPEPPSACRPGVPAGLDALVLSLLAQDPADRPGSAADVVAILSLLAMEVRPAGDPAPGGTPFVGREEELRRLTKAMQDSGRGGGGLALITGDAGIGKTRIVLELAARARADGWSVLAGRCFDGDEAPPFWPWTQVLRAAAREHGLERLRRLAGPAAELVAALLPELGDAAPSPTPADDDPGRFRLFDAVAATLRALGAGRPLLVVIDDLHWADPASLALTAFLARDLDGSPVAVVACRRPPDGLHLHPASGQVRAAAACTLELAGLPREDSDRFVQLTAGVRPDAALLDDLWSRTDGNPFFLGELVRLLSAEQRLVDAGQLVPGAVALPEGVREVLSRRLQLVSPKCADLLRAAAVLGREISVEVLRHVSGVDEAALHTHLEEAVRARLLAALPGIPLRYRFAHALVQEFLYDDLTPVRRAELHDRTGKALLEVHSCVLDAHVAELAHHFVRASGAGSSDEALRWSVRAGHAATAASAYEEAAAHFSRALGVLESSAVTASGDEERGAVLLALGEAQCRAGSTDEGRASFSCAADEGLLRGDAQLLAHAALGYGVGLGGYGFVAQADGVLLSLLEEALVNLGEQDTVLRVRVLARLATELYFTPFRSRRLAVSEQAVAVARRLGDPWAELVAVYSRTAALLGPDGLEAQREAAERTLTLARVLGDQDMQFRAHALRLAVALGLGDPEQVGAEVQACRELADQLRRPLHTWHAAVFEAMTEIQAGRLRQARERADEALHHGLRGHRDMAMVMYGAQQLVLHWAGGRLPAVLDSVRFYADHYPHAPAWRAALAYCLVETGRPEAARHELGALAHKSFADIPRDANFLTATSLLALTAARLGDRARCALLERLLAPYADRQVVLAGGAVGYFSVSYPLGMLAAARDDLDEALRRLTRAQEQHERRGARLHVVDTATEQVRLLLQRGAEGDAAAARALLSQALPAARQIGMAVAVQRLESLAALLCGLAPTPRPRAAAGAAAGTVEGDAVTVLLTDVAGSTALTERLGERAMHAMLLEHRRLVSSAAGLYGGLVLKSLGDGALCVFPDAAGALRCAAWLQAQAEDRLGLPGLQLRIGVHTGPVLRDGESMYGRSMILAHRIADRAGPGEVLVSATTHAAVDGAGLRFERAEAVELKGFDAPQVVHRLVCRGA